MRRSPRSRALALRIWLGLGLAALPLAAPAQAPRLSVEIHEPAPGSVISPADLRAGRVEVVGGASIYGGVRALDLFLVLDSSESLRRTDRDDHRTRGVIQLVRSLHPKANIHLGVVDFDTKARLIAALTPDRRAVIEALQTLDQKGETDLAAGIRAALEGFAERSRPEASKVILLFTDGKSDEKKALEAMAEGRRAGVAIHTLLLGREQEGERLLREIARGTDASFVAVTDPVRLPDAFANLRTTGVERVSLRVGNDPPVAARLLGGSFSAELRLLPGRNRIEAVATSLSGETARSVVEVVLSGALRVSIESPLDGAELSDADRAVVVRGQASTWDTALEELGGPPRDSGIREVWLRVNDSQPYPTQLVGGRFEGRVPIADGENRLVAIATSTDGRSAQHAIQLASRAPGCAELEIQAMRGDQPAISLSDRAIELVFDASNSMWGRMQSEPKISVAKRALSQAIDALPDDVSLALRVYGHQFPHAERRCQDSELLVPVTRGSRAPIQDAIRGFKPRGQTPLAYSLRQVALDLARFRGERAVVLVTDGIESCDGDPVAAARDLQRIGDVPVHVIGFGLDSAGDEDLLSLRGIAAASGGRFFTADSADELREALATTVGTPFALIQGGQTRAKSTLGSKEPLRVPGGEYQLRVESTPAYQVPITLEQERGLTLMLKRDGAKVFHARRHREIPYARCDPASAQQTEDDLLWEELPDTDSLPAAPLDPRSP